MPEIGRINRLCVLREVSSGLFLNGGETGDILLPGRYIPPGTKPGDWLDVFLYTDSEDRLIATTEKPVAQVGEFGSFKVVATVPRMGAFLDWGLSKDLLLPLREQSRRVSIGERIVAHVVLDELTQRIIASTRLGRHVSKTFPEYKQGQAVNILVASETPLGLKVIVENAHLGLLYHTETSTPPEPGSALTAYVRAVREDGKVDLGLDPAGYQRVKPLTEQILSRLRETRTLPFDDSSSPEDIRREFNTSKKAFKQALGALYRKHAIRFTNPGIELAEPQHTPKSPSHPKPKPRR